MALTPTSETKFTDVNPGSRVRISSPQNIFDPYEAQVLSVEPEFGPSSLPALVLKKDGEEPILVLSDGTKRVAVIMDAGKLATNVPPPEAVHFRAKPIEVYGVEFKGGVDSATTIIQFAAGKASIQWTDRTDQMQEHMTIVGLGESQMVRIFDWVIQTPNGKFVKMNAEDIEARYSVIDE